MEYYFKFVFHILRTIICVYIYQSFNQVIFNVIENIKKTEKKMENLNYEKRKNQMSTMFKMENKNDRHHHHHLISVKRKKLKDQQSLKLI